MQEIMLNASLFHVAFPRRSVVVEHLARRRLIGPVSTSYLGFGLGLRLENIGMYFALVRRSLSTTYEVYDRLIGKYCSEGRKAKVPTTGIIWSLKDLTGSLNRFERRCVEKAPSICGNFTENCNTTTTTTTHIISSHGAHLDAFFLHLLSWMLAVMMPLDCEPLRPRIARPASLCRISQTRTQRT
jgi:hypothetical protein